MSDVDTSQTNHLSFCAGYGGIDLALKSVVPDGRTIAYVEIEAFAIANLVAKMEAGELDQAPVWTDVKTFPAEDFYGLVDIISGGYPCQPFSAAGKRRGTEDPRHLWPHIRRAIRSIRPGRVFLENVEGHISLGLSSVISDLDEDGYRATWGIFSAAECGASHQRKRVFIMADGKCAGLEGHSGDEQDPTGSGWTGPDRSVGPSGLPQRFPARPGQPQFDWEESRTVGNAGGAEPDRTPDQQERAGVPETGKPSAELADTGHPESSGRDGEAQGQLRIPRGESAPQDCGDGELADTTGGRCQQREPQRQTQSDTGDPHKQEIRRQTEPQLGRATDGRTGGVDATTHRVDRLRLLGNGVVPATAAKAWTVLSGRFE